MPKNPRIPPMPRAIEILAFPDLQVLDVAGPLQVFASANDLERQVGCSPPYAIRVVAQASPVNTSAGLPLVTEPLPSMRKPVDTLIVAGGSSVHEAAEDKRLVRWLAGR